MFCEDLGSRIFVAPRLVLEGLLEHHGHHRGELLHGLLLPHHRVSQQLKINSVHFIE